MIRFSWKYPLLRALSRLTAADGALDASACQDWMRDPLSHPALSAMSLTELADLPARQLRSCCRE